MAIAKFGWNCVACLLAMLAHKFAALAPRLTKERSRLGESTSDNEYRLRALRGNAGAQISISYGDGAGSVGWLALADAGTRHLSIFGRHQSSIRWANESNPKASGGPLPT